MLLFSYQIWPKCTPPFWADTTTWWGRATAFMTPWSTRTTRSCTRRTSGPAWVWDKYRFISLVSVPAAVTSPQLQHPPPPAAVSPSEASSSISVSSCCLCWSEQRTRGSFHTAGISVWLSGGYRELIITSTWSIMLHITRTCRIVSNEKGNHHKQTLSWLIYSYIEQQQKHIPTKIKTFLSFQACHY